MAEATQSPLTPDCTCVQSSEMHRPQLPLELPPHPRTPVRFEGALSTFHPVVARWFAERLGEASAPQQQGWPLIRAGSNVLIAAPTGSGKTLAAFLACLDELFREALEGRLPDQTRVLYVSPLKALGNDVQQNLIRPLEEIYQRARAEGLDPQTIRVQVRSGDTRPSERVGMAKRPPHILITTPEPPDQLVIFDEIHALSRDTRASHFCLSMEGLKGVAGCSPHLGGQ